MTENRRFLIVRVVPCAVVMGAMSSCNILSPAAYLAMGQDKAPAKYVLEDRSTVVFVDDRNNAIPVNSTRVRGTIAETVTTTLMTEDLLSQTISARDALAVARSRDRDGKLLSMGAIGEMVGAEQIIYIEMLSFRGSPDNRTPRPSGACRVKVLDVVAKTRLYPPPDAESGWEDVVVMTATVSPEMYRNSQGRRKIEMMLSTTLADQVAKLFYKHVPDEIGSRLTPP
jgi:hypothetical protein